MATQVQILPSGHSFISEGHLSLLAAGLQAGLALGYGCSNGNCGKCEAKIISGDVEKTRHHDFPISANKKANGHVLMCCNTALTDVVLEAPEALGSNEIPQQQLTAKVRNITIINDAVALLHLKTPRTARLRFLAGQYVQLGGNHMPRAHISVGSCPCDDMNLHFQIPYIEGDEFSDFIFTQLKKGDQVDVNGPGGDFILNEKSKHPLVFIAWHTGFGPVRSLIEHAMALEVTETIHLVWVTEDSKGRYLDNLCRSWNDALDDFNYVPINSKSNIKQSDIYKHIISSLEIKADVLNQYDFYVAGNPSLLDSCGQGLTLQGLPAGQLVMSSLVHE